MVPRETARRPETEVSAATRCASVTAGLMFCSTALLICGNGAAAFSFEVSSDMSDAFDVFLILASSLCRYARSYVRHTFANVKPWRFFSRGADAQRRG